MYIFCANVLQFSQQSTFSPLIKQRFIVFKKFLWNKSLFGKLFAKSGKSFFGNLHENQNWFSRKKLIIWNLILLIVAGRTRRSSSGTRCPWPGIPLSPPASSPSSPSSTWTRRSSSASGRAGRSASFLSQTCTRHVFRNACGADEIQGFP